MARLTPPIGAVGLYELTQPWLASTTKVYTNKAIRSFADLRVKNIDPYTLAYKPYGSTQAQATEDEAAGACIISLFADDGEVIYVPDTKIVSYPNQGNWHYRHLILSLDLGLIPDNLSLDWAQAKVVEELQGIVGIKPIVKLHEGVLRNSVTQAEHDRLEAARAALKVNQVTTLAQLVIARQQLADLTQRYQELETYVTQNNLVLPSTTTK